MGNDDNSHGNNGFWQSIPGTLTSLAAVITAVAGLLATLKPGALTSAFSSPTPSPTVSGGGTPVASTPVFSQGTLTVRGTFSCDLDTGAESDFGTADFWWDQETATRRSLVPKNGAGFLVLGGRDFESVTCPDLRRMRYSTVSIDGSDATYNRLPQGTVVAYKTRSGKLGKFRVEQYGRDLELRWITYAVEN